MESTVGESFSMLSSWRKEVHNRMECYLVRYGVCPKLKLKILNRINIIAHNVVNGMELNKAVDEAVDLSNPELPTYQKKKYTIFLYAGKKTHLSR